MLEKAQSKFTDMKNPDHSKPDKELTKFEIKDMKPHWTAVHTCLRPHSDEKRFLPKLHAFVSISAFIHNKRHSLTTFNLSINIEKTL